MKNISEKLSRGLYRNSNNIIELPSNAKEVRIHVAQNVYENISLNVKNNIGNIIINIIRNKKFNELETAYSHLTTLMDVIY
jgi:hypothetical protein